MGKMVKYVQEMEIELVKFINMKGLCDWKWQTHFLPLANKHDIK